MPSAAEIVQELRTLGNPTNVAGMARYGINPEGTLGITVPVLRALAKRVGRNHALALELWDSGVHKARHLAAMIADPKATTDAQMEQWVAQIDSWDICDGTCASLFEKTPMAWDKAVEWCARPEEYVKRAGFVLMARLTVSDKKAADERFAAFLPIIVREAGDTERPLDRVGRRPGAIKCGGAGKATRLNVCYLRAASPHYPETGARRIPV